MKARKRTPKKTATSGALSRVDFDPIVRCVSKHFAMYLTGCTPIDVASLLGMPLDDAERRLRELSESGAIVARDTSLSVRYEPCRT